MKRPGPATTLGAIAVAAVALLSWRPVNNDDTFMYLATGQWVSNHRRIPDVDPFSWTFLGHPWQSTGWGWGLILSLGDRIAGTAGVAATKPLLVCGIAAGTIWTARRLGARAAPAWLATITALVALTPWITDRAQMASYAIFPITLGLADRATAGRRLHLGWLAGLLALQVVWINVHSAGLISAPFLGVFLAGRVLDRFSDADDRSLRGLVGVAVGPAATLVAATAALLVNPWGWGMFTHASDTRALSRATISEWAPLLRAGPAALVAIVTVIVAAIGFRRGRSRLRWCLVLPCLLGAVMTVDAVRNTPFLVLAAAMFVPPALPRAPGRFAERIDLARVGAATFAILAVVVAATTVPDTTRPGPGIPTRATAALPARCQLRNLSGMGGYVLATRGDIPVSADGRNDLYGLSGYAQNTWFTGNVTEARRGLDQIDREGTDCVLARPDSTLVSLLDDAGWQVVGADPSGISLVRPGKDQS